MKKLVIKTVFITVISILIGCFAIMSAFCIFKPRVIAKIFDNLGNYNASQYFYQQQYTKTGEIKDLFEIIDNAYEVQDNIALRKGLGQLIADDEFNAYCVDKNGLVLSGNMKTEEYYASWYAEMLYVTGDFGFAVDFSKTYVLKDDGSVKMGYTKFNPFRALVDIRVDLSQEQKSQLRQAILETKESITDLTELSYIEQDLNKLN